MPVKIAVAGKGGVGKTTVVCGIVAYLISKGATPILVVDADPNSNLAENLGLSYSLTIADVREELRNIELPSGIAKTDYIISRLQETVVEYKGFDLVVMGRPEGKECYCYVNELLRTFLSNLAKSYKYVLIDTEAGMEHLSRRTTDNIDFLFIITTPIKSSLQTVEKILTSINNLKLKIYNSGVILNMATTNDKPLPFPVVGKIYYDDKIYKFSESGEPLLKNVKNTNFYSDLTKILSTVIKEQFLE